MRAWIVQETSESFRLAELPALCSSPATLPSPKARIPQPQYDAVDFLAIEFCSEMTYRVPASKGRCSGKDGELGRSLGRLRVVPSFVELPALHCSRTVFLSPPHYCLGDEFCLETTYRVPASKGRCAGKDGSWGGRLGGSESFRFVELLALRYYSTVFPLPNAATSLLPWKRILP